MPYTKQVTFSNVLWKLIERVGAQGVSLIVSIILARLLSPNDYGVISVVTIFITLADVFVNKGLGSALIQKKEADELDYSSILIVNVGLSLLLYGIIFFSAPAISVFFGMDILCIIVRILGVQTIFNSFLSIMTAYIARNMLFRKSFMATFVGTVVSAIVGIAMAMHGFGVWALVAQQLINTVLNVILLYISVGWRPKLIFSATRVGSLLPFGLRILGAALIDVGFRQLRQIIIGKKYTSQDLAYFNKGATFPQQIIANVNIAVYSVLYPTLAGIQDDEVKFINHTRASLRLTSYLYFPLMAGLACIAPSFVAVLLTDRWLPSVVYLQVYCIEYSTWCIQTTHETAIKSSGNSRLLLSAEMVRKVIILIILIVAMQYGMIGMAYSVLMGTLVNVIALCFFCQKAIGYTMWMQLKDMMPAGTLVIILVVFCYPINWIDIAPILKMMMQIVVGVFVYLTSSVATKNKEWSTLKSMVINMFFSWIHK